MIGSQEQITYTVEVSRAGDFYAPWWRIGNMGSPAQVAAALRELAVRIDRELDPYPNGWCRHRYEMHDYDGVLLEHFTGPVRLCEITLKLRAAATRAERVTLLDLGCPSAMWS
ncbi:hypothetical protein [Nocardia alni]|uniref:hypothetical protein n=1 Tax=Nocardia alni TaxID=2815723 RepID=UPI001C23A90A|nr:hypothetical protein [Nocardia alni]